MTYTPPPYSGPGGTPAWSPSLPSTGGSTSQHSPDLPPRVDTPRRRGPLIVGVVSAVALVAAASLWLTTLSRNNDLLANNQQLIEQVDTLQADRDSLTSRNAGLRADIDDATESLATCVAALDAAEDTVELLSEVLDISGDAIEAASTWNSTRLESLTRDVEQLNAPIERSATEYAAAASGCRAGS